MGEGAPFPNLSTSYAKGIDFEVAYNLVLNLFDNEVENLSLRLLGGYLIDRFNQPPGGAPIDQIGGSTRPEITANATLRDSVGPLVCGLAAALYQRYAGKHQLG